MWYAVLSMLIIHFVISFHIFPHRLLTIVIHIGLSKHAIELNIYSIPHILLFIAKYPYYPSIRIRFRRLYILPFSINQVALSLVLV